MLLCGLCGAPGPRISCESAEFGGAVDVMTGYHVTGRNLDKRRILRCAPRGCEWAPLIKTAAGRRPQEVGVICPDDLDVRHPFGLLHLARLQADDRRFDEVDFLTFETAE